MPCKCDDLRGHARAVEAGIFQCLMNALNDPEKESFWRNKADMLEQKFMTDHGRHYSDFISTTPPEAPGHGE